MPEPVDPGRAPALHAPDGQDHLCPHRRWRRADPALPARQRIWAGAAAICSTSEFDLGDFIQASGEMFRTRTGEITLRVQVIPHAGQSRSPRCRRPRMRWWMGKWCGTPRSPSRKCATASATPTWPSTPRCARSSARAPAIVTRAARVPGRARLPGGGNAHPAADLRRRGGAALRHPSQPAQPGPVPAHLVRAVSQTPAGGRLRARLRDRARFPQRRRDRSSTTPSSPSSSSTWPMPIT